MLVKNDSPVSAPEITLLKQKIEGQHLETIFLRQKIEQKNQEITYLLQKIGDKKKKQFLSRIKQKINGLITHKFHSRKEPVVDETRYVQYPEIVIIKASHLFDRDWYLAQYPHVKKFGLEPEQHYLQLGAKKGYDPGPHFSTRDYLSLYSDVNQMNPLVHYEVVGKAEERSCRIETTISTFKPFLMGNKIKITFISGEPDTPGHFYRIARYASAAKAIGVDVVELTVPTAVTQLEQITNSNVLFVWRAGWTEQLPYIFSAARKAHVPIIFDADDLVIDPTLAKINIVDGIRTTGVTEKAVERFFGAMQTTMEQADYCSATTNYLANYMRSFGKRTFVLPNGFDELIWQTSRLAVRARLNSHYDGLIRIGYAGGSRTHQKDFAKIADVIARLLQEHANCRLVLFRKQTLPCIDIEEFPALLSMSNQIEWREMVPLPKLPWEMARFDINLAPLEVGNPFCEAKSELKFFESALVEVPIVASPTQPFSEAIENGKTGFLATDEESWYNILSKLLSDSALRQQIARCAYYDVLWKYGSEQRIDLMSSMIDTMIHPGPRAARAFEFNLLKSKNNSYIIPIIPVHEIIVSYDKLNISEVTVIIPSYNYGHYLIEALESVKHQTLLNIDLVIVDDCSKDNSIEVASQWLNENKDRFNRAMLIKNNVNSGLAYTRNVGFAHAETLFVLPLDPDNSLLPNFAATCLTKIKETNAAFVYPSIQRFGDENYVMGDQPYDPMLFTCGNYIDAMALIRLSAWAYVGGYHHLKYGWEDYDFWCRFVEHGLFGYHVEEILARYRVHGNSMINTVTNRDNGAKVRADIQSRHSWLVQTQRQLEHVKK